MMFPPVCLATVTYQRGSTVARPRRAPVGRTGRIKKRGRVPRRAQPVTMRLDQKKSWPRGAATRIGRVAMPTVMVGSVAGFSIGLNGRVFVVGLNRLDRSILCFLERGRRDAVRLGGLGLVELLERRSGRDG